MLLDSHRNLKLSDLDRAMEIGKEIAVLTEQFGRLLSEEDGGGHGSYGKAGARAEAFAIGSVYYTLLRGHESYETECWGEEHFVILCERLQNKEFPPLLGSCSDAVVSRCWNGNYRAVSELLAEFQNYAEQEDTSVVDQNWINSRQVESKMFIQNGLVDKLERY